jgi:hypothetical protein
MPGGIVAKRKTASGGNCAGSDTRRMGVDFKKEGSSTALFLYVPVWLTPAAAQEPPEANLPLPVFWDDAP